MDDVGIVLPSLFWLELLATVFDIHCSGYHDCIRKYLLPTSILVLPIITLLFVISPATDMHGSCLSSAPRKAKRYFCSLHWSSCALVGMA